MEEDNQEDKPSRYRSPAFSKDEVKSLIHLIDKYKLFVLNKSVTLAACQSKEAAWVKITKVFNSQNLGHVRTAESLKMKWENMKKDARKLTKNIIDPKQIEFNEINTQIVTMLAEADNIGDINMPQETFSESDGLENGIEENNDKEAPSFTKYWDERIDKQSGNESDDNEENGRSNRDRSGNFSPQECSLLLQCVRQEKKHVFCKEVTGRAIELKNSAWSRITNSYNKLSPQKRSTKVLRTKFNNMKTLARKVGFKHCFKDLSNKHEKLVNENTKRIKKEPAFDYDLNAESDHLDNDNDDIGNHKTNDGHKASDYVDLSRDDPLTSILHSDSGIGSTSLGTWNHSEQKELVKLKMELLNYQIETAKLERKRIEDAIKEETAVRESRTIETALRLRAARLDAVAAEMKFPLTHPALIYTAQETRAQHYLTQYHQT